MVATKQPPFMLAPPRPRPNSADRRHIHSHHHRRHHHSYHTATADASRYRLAIEYGHNNVRREDLQVSVGPDALEMREALGGLPAEGRGAPLVAGRTDRYRYCSTLHPLSRAVQCGIYSARRTGDPSSRSKKRFEALRRKFVPAALSWTRTGITHGQGERCPGNGGMRDGSI